MKRGITILIGIICMGLASICSLFVVSIFTYIWKWQADKAMIGITITYIIAGFVGGLSMKWVPKCWNRWRRGNTKTTEAAASTGKKLLESLLTGTIFIIFLMILAAFLTVEEIALSGRLLLIWMLLTGSTALGRIL